MGHAGQEPYIYQRLRTQGVKPLYLSAAITTLERLSKAIFDEAILLDKTELEQQIANTILTERLSLHATHAVEVRLYPSHKVEIVTEDMLYLEPFPLRAIRPTARPYRISGDMLHHPTSARDALLNICRADNKLPSESIAMWVDHNNEITAIDGAPVIAVTDNEIRFSHVGHNIEFDIAERAMSKTSHKVVYGEIRYDEALNFKELLYIDHRGVVALADIEGHALSNIIAERIAKEVSKIEKM